MPNPIKDNMILYTEYGLEDMFPQADSDQFKAITYQENGPLLILAGPGSGKTYTITQRLRYLTEIKKVPAEKILVLTFTREAAKSMQLRSNQPTVNFGTFHSVFYQILKQSKVITENDIFTEADKKKLLTPVLDIFVPQNDYSGKYHALKDASEAISSYKNTLSYDAAKRGLPDYLKNHFEEILHRYEQIRGNQHKHDFDDILIDCKNYLEHNQQERQYWQNRFDEILIDEFQDINAVQYEVIKLLCKAPYNVFAVGDDDQAIYGFRGSNPKCMRQFAEEFHAEVIGLRHNYRSQSRIVQMASDMIAKNQQRFEKSVIFERKDEQNEVSVIITDFEEEEKQNEYLKVVLGQERECAVLFRTNRMMQRMASFLKKQGIPFEMKEKSKSIYEEEVVKDIMAYLILGKKGTNKDLLLRIINRPSRYMRRERYEVLLKEFDKKESDCLSQMLKGLCPEETELKMRLELLQKQLQNICTMPLFLAIQYIRRVIGYDKWVEEKYKNSPMQKEEMLQELEWLATQAKEFENLDDWLSFQNEYVIELRNNQNSQYNLIKLMTVHAAKGLEFDTVIIPSCNERIFPYGIMQETDVLEEERRIFYVALTRAKNHLEILYISGTDRNPRMISRFLSEKMPES